MLMVFQNVIGPVAQFISAGTRDVVSEKVSAADLTKYSCNGVT
jgi:hypothetical protein